MKRFKLEYVHKAALIAGLLMAVVGLVRAIGAENHEAGFAYAVALLLWCTAILNQLTIDLLWKRLRQREGD